MKTVNNEIYVSPEMAELLKKAGFDLNINTAYRDGELVFQANHLTDNFNAKKYEISAYKFFSAPTLDVAQRWLRENKLISVESQVVKWVNRYQTNECTIFWRYIILSIDTSSQEAFHRIVDIDNGFVFNTYEEALEAGVKKALEIIL